MKLVIFLTTSFIFIFLSCNTLGYVYIQNKASYPIYYTYFVGGDTRSEGIIQADTPGNYILVLSKKEIKDGLDDCMKESIYPFVCFKHHALFGWTGWSSFNIYVPTDTYALSDFEDKDGNPYRLNQTLYNIKDHSWYIFDPDPNLSEHFWRDTSGDRKSHIAPAGTAKADG